MLLIGMIESQRDLVTFGDTQSNNNQQLPQSTEHKLCIKGQFCALCFESKLIIFNLTTVILK